MTSTVQMFKNIGTASKPGKRFIVFWTSIFVQNAWKCFVFLWLFCRFVWFMFALLLRVAKQRFLPQRELHSILLVKTFKIRSVFWGLWKDQTKFRCGRKTRVFATRTSRASRKHIVFSLRHVLIDKTSCHGNRIQKYKEHNIWITQIVS